MAKASDYNRKKRRELSRLCAMANKRIKRLIDKGWTDVPAYQALIKYGKPHFGVKGLKTSQEVNNELIRVNHFLESITSTIKGATGYLQDLATNMGVTGMKASEIQQHAKQFFQIVKMVQKRLTSEENKIYSSTRLFNAVSAQFKAISTTLNEGASVEDKLQSIISSLRKVEKVEEGYEGFTDNIFGENFEFLRKK